MHIAIIPMCSVNRKWDEHKRRGECEIEKGTYDSGKITNLERWPASSTLDGCASVCGSVFVIYWSFFFRCVAVESGGEHTPSAQTRHTHITIIKRTRTFTYNHVKYTDVVINLYMVNREFRTRRSRWQRHRSWEVERVWGAQWEKYSPIGFLHDENGLLAMRRVCSMNTARLAHCGPSKSHTNTHEIRRAKH